MHVNIVLLGPWDWDFDLDLTITNHTCPEAKTQFIELFMDIVNGFLLLLSHIKNIDKAWNPEQKEKKCVSLLVELEVKKWGLDLCFGLVE